MSFYETVTGEYKAYLHDPAALIACEATQLFSMERIRLNVLTEGERIGEMVRDDNSPRVCNVCTDVAAAAVVSRFRDPFSKLP